MNLIRVESGHPQEVEERMRAARGRGLQLPIGYEFEAMDEWLEANVHGDVIVHARNIPFSYQYTVFVMDDVEWSHFLLRWSDDGEMR